MIINLYHSSDCDERKSLMVLNVNYHLKTLTTLHTQTKPKCRCIYIEQQAA